LDQVLYWMVRWRAFCALLATVAYVSSSRTFAEEATPQPSPSRIQAMIAEAWTDATETWAKVLGERAYRADIPQINFVPAVRASHCYGLYIGAGPVYCSGNTTVFVSIAAMEDLARKIPAVGDAGLAFLVAHELGHHIQKVTGRFRTLNAMVRNNPNDFRKLTLRFELEADCLAGVWASNSPKFAASAATRAALLTALDAIGDDRIIGSNGAVADPNTFTHGTSAQRIKWFQHGLSANKAEACDVLGAEAL
jgi:uncharacterized protein